MSESRLPSQEDRRIGIGDRTVIIATIIGISVAVFLVAGIYSPMNTLIGIALLATLYATDIKESKRWSEQVSFAVAWGLSFILIVGFIVVNPYIPSGHDPYAFMEIPAIRGVVRIFGDEAPNVVSATVGLVAALVVFTIRARKVLMTSEHTPPPPGTPTSSPAVIQASHETSQTVPGFKEVVATFAFLNLPFFLWYIVALVSKKTSKGAKR